MAEQGRPQRTGASGRSKRGSILDAAVELFLELGFDQTSMDAVAARAGVSKTTVYAHFGDKLELFRAVIARGGDSSTSIWTRRCWPPSTIPRRGWRASP